MISILIPTYNYNVLPLVENLQNQCETASITYEILVLDDASPNKNFNTKNSKINELENCSFQILDENVGRSKIRNHLANDAKFDWLLFLDADIMPKMSKFIEKYISTIISNEPEVIYGGITYQQEKPVKNKMLRWKYGNAREVKTVTERLRSPFDIISQNLLIFKPTFLNANTVFENYYGLDIFFSNQLKRMSAKIIHIDNPVIHFGLEENYKFLNKALQAVETTALLEKKGLIDNDVRPLQKSYLKLEKMHCINVFSTLISPLKRKMERNFISKKPNLFWFDLYRLYHFIQHKKKYNA